ncbi:MAG: CCT domain-containing protein [bacterium]
MNYNDFDSCSDLYLGFDCDDVAVVPQMTAEDDSISSLMFPTGNALSSLDMFQLGDFDGLVEAEAKKVSGDNMGSRDPLALDLVDLDFAVPESMTAMPTLGEFIPNSLPDLIMESDEDDMQDDAAVPTFSVRAKGTMSVKPSVAMRPAPSSVKRSRTSDHGYGKSDFAYTNEWESDDAESDDEYVAPRRGRRMSRRPAARSATALEMPDNLTREERVARWLEKKKRRVFKKTVRYESRKQYADKRPRIKGRFVAPEIYAAYMAEKAAAQVVPSC